MPSAARIPAPVQWPVSAYDETGKDLGQPVRDLLYGLRLLEDPAQEGDVTPRGGTPVSLQVVTAGATSLAKWWAVLIAAIGGGGTVAAAVKSWLAAPQNTGTQYVTIAAAAVLGSAVVLAIAVIVRADVHGRATASAAEYAARGRVVEAVLNNFQYGRPAPPQPEPEKPEPQYWVQTTKGWTSVKRFEWDDNCLKVRLADDTIVDPAHLRWLMPGPPNGASAKA